MRRVLIRLPALQAALSLPIPGYPSPLANASEVDAFIRAIKRKARFAEMHIELLQGIQWERVDGIGRRGSQSAEPDFLLVKLGESTLRIDHPGAVIDHVYLAFDGLIAALVNMTDTMARLLNLAYQLQIKQRQASLFAVRDQCHKTSPLGVVLFDSQYTEWLLKLRDIRGKCQHAEIEDVLYSHPAPYASRGEPFVNADYCWTIPSRHTQIVSYAKDAVDATEKCLDAIISAVVASPQNPTT